MSKTDNAVRDYVKGLGITVACQRNDIAKHTLTNELTRRSISYHHYNKVYGPNTINVMRAYRDFGHTLKQIADRFGISTATVHNYLSV